MRKQWKGFILGVLVTTMVFTLAMPVAAAVRNLKADFLGIKITLDGRTLTPKDANGKVVEPFAVEGTTYLPLRAVAEALGLEVGWHGPTKTVRLNTNGGTQPPVATPTPQPPVDDLSYEITYQNCNLYEDTSGETRCYAIIEVLNTGNCDLYLKDAVFDFEDQTGKLLATYSSLISSDPDIIAPGEKGYFYCNSASINGDVNSHTDYVFKPTLRIEKSKNPIIRYEISDLSMKEGQFGPVQIIGRITNNTDEDDSMVWVSCILFRADGTPIAAHGTNVMGVKAGQTVSFDADAIYLHGLNLDYSEVASYKVYAGRTQYQ